MESVQPGVSLERNRSHDSAGTPWSPVRRVLFRFLFSYVAMYCVELLAITTWLVTIGVGGSSDGPFTIILWSRVIPLIGRSILHLQRPITTFIGSSSDTTYDYVLVLTELVIAAVVAMAWTLFDRRRSNYRTLYAWMRVAVRTMLAAMLLSYGLDKLIPVQFHTYIPLYTLSRPWAPWRRLDCCGRIWPLRPRTPSSPVCSKRSQVSCSCFPREQPSALCSEPSRWAKCLSST